MDSTTGADTLVVIGASYAKAWAVEELAALDVVNAGVNGDETSGMLERFESDVIDREPEVVIVWGFINDIFRGKRARMDEVREKAYSNTVRMIERARGQGIVPVLATEVTIRRPAGLVETLKYYVGTAMGKTSYQQYVNSQVRSVNERLRSYAAGNNVTLLDFESVLANEDGSRIARFAQDDGSHLTPAAYDALTEHARQALGTPIE